MTGFSPHQENPKHCELCKSFGGWIESFHDGESRWDVYVWCNRFRQAQAQPSRGCAFWSAPDEKKPADQL